MLLIGATLLFTSFRYLLRLDAGFNATGVVTATIFPPPSRYPNQQSVVALLDRVLERVRAIPAIDAAGITSNIALSGFESPSSVTVVGRAADDRTAVIPSVVAITPGYFEAMNTPLVRGRFFAASDRGDSLRVAIVDQRLASRLWPDADPLGKGIMRGDAGPYTVVGVVRDVRLEGLAASIDSIGTAYFPHTQAPPQRRLRWIAIRSSVDSAAVIGALRAALLAIDPDLPIADIQTMTERTANTLVSQRLATSLATMFAAVALLLSMLGLYGVLVSLVATRTREIGIRLALGSTMRGVLRLVLTEGVVLVGVGLLLGMAGAIAMAQTLQGLVFGVQPTDPAAAHDGRVGDGRRRPAGVHRTRAPGDARQSCRSAVGTVSSSRAARRRTEAPSAPREDAGRSPARSYSWRCRSMKVVTSVIGHQPPAASSSMT